MLVFDSLADLEADSDHRRKLCSSGVSCQKDKVQDTNLSVKFLGVILLGKIKAIPDGMINKSRLTPIIGICGLARFLGDSRTTYSYFVLPFMPYDPERRNMGSHIIMHWGKGHTRNLLASKQARLGTGLGPVTTQETILNTDHNP